MKRVNVPGSWSDLGRLLGRFLLEYNKFTELRNSGKFNRVNSDSYSLQLFQAQEQPIDFPVHSFFIQIQSYKEERFLEKGTCIFRRSQTKPLHFILPKPSGLV